MAKWVTIKREITRELIKEIILHLKIEYSVDIMKDEVDHLCAATKICPWNSKWKNWDDTQHVNEIYGKKETLEGYSQPLMVFILWLKSVGRSRRRKLLFYTLLYFY